MTTQRTTYPVVDSLIGIFAEWLKHRREVAEVCNCDAGEYARIAQDLGVSPGELTDLVRRGPHAADELPKMMAALNLDVAAITRAQPAVMRDLERVCARCKFKRRCEQELANDTAAQNHEEYCDNASTLDTLTLEDDVVEKKWFYWRP